MKKEIQEFDKKYTKLYYQYNNLKHKNKKLLDLITMLKMENIEHIRDKVKLQDQLLYKDCKMYGSKEDAELARKQLIEW